MQKILNVFALGVFLSFTALAQTSSITGTVTDPTGAVIPAAKITMFNVDTGAERIAARKQARIGYLKNYWASRAQSMPKVKLHTSLNLQYSCAICGVSVDGMSPSELENALFDRYKIHTVGIVWENIKCVRVTPHVYTSIADLDKLVRALSEISSKA